MVSLRSLVAVRLKSMNRVITAPIPAADAPRSSRTASRKSAADNPVGAKVLQVAKQKRKPRPATERPEIRESAIDSCVIVFSFPSDNLFSSSGTT